MKSGFLKHWLMIITVLTLFSYSCTIVKHDEKNEAQDDELTFYFQDGSFDAASFVEGIWDSRVIPTFLEESNSLSEVLATMDSNPDTANENYGRKAEIDSPFTFRVNGSATIKTANTTSAASTVELSIDNYTGSTTVNMQIGPVIKNSAVRDSLEFISFGDFTNQLEYAGVSKELNFTVRDTVVTVLDRDNLVGTSFQFYAAFIAIPGEPILLTPVILQLGGSDG